MVIQMLSSANLQHRFPDFLQKDFHVQDNTAIFHIISSHVCSILFSLFYSNQYNWYASLLITWKYFSTEDGLYDELYNSVYRFDIWRIFCIRVWPCCSIACYGSRLYDPQTKVYWQRTVGSVQMGALCIHK